ncbi:protein amnionless [Drosophila innubila]|uniref:protein amnionless n=1 Tax=Drosophila innubila TaxID=198719 RepID=UPI00148CBDC0|nr:protein amnionless [Drosophila innubila]
MLQPKRILIILGSLLLLEADTTTIKWHSAGAPFGSPSAWLDNYLPCVHDLVVFPEYYPAIMPIPTDVSVRGFMLPRQGALLLAEESTINLVTAKATGRGLNSDCDSDERRAYLKPPKTSKWFDPSSWSVQPGVAGGSSVSLSAVPELERVPCDDEHVVISSSNGALSFDLENVQYLRLGQLVLAGSSISRTYLQELMSRELGQLLFHNAQGVSVEYYRGELCGCHKDYEHLIEPVCRNVESQCEQPHCVSPIRPLGSCCFLCGAMMTVSSQNCMAENRQSLLSYMNKLINRDNLADELQVHVDFVGSKEYGNYLQAIIIDRGSYSGRSIEFTRRLEAQRNESSFLSTATGLEVKYAGHPYNPNVTFASVLLILFCVVLVGVVSIIILAHYMPQNPYLNRIPQWIHDPRRWRWHHLGMRLRRNLLFNRFDDASSGAPTAAGSAVERLPVIGYDAESGEVRERSFNNPMLEQEEMIPTTAEMSQPIVKPESCPNVLSPNVETGELDSCSGEEQELTEINLESSEAESDFEAETKE